jgi:hypothetical protein
MVEGLNLYHSCSIKYGNFCFTAEKTVYLGECSLHILENEYSSVVG